MRITSGSANPTVGLKELQPNNRSEQNGVAGLPRKCDQRVRMFSEVCSYLAVKNQYERWYTSEGMLQCADYRRDVTVGQNTRELSTGPTKTVNGRFRSLELK